MKRQLNTIVFFILIIGFFGCKKPKKGEYEMKLTSHTGSVTILTCDITKKFGGLWFITERKDGLTGTMDFYELKLRQKAFYTELNQENTPYNGNTLWYKLKGTSSRKKLSGTYEFLSTGSTANTGYYLYQDSGTFEMNLQK